MNKTLKNVAIILDLAAFAGSIYWYSESKEIEAIISMITTFGVLVGLVLVNSDKNNENQKEFKQKAGKKSTQYQSGGNMTINKK